MARKIVHLLPVAPEFWDQSTTDGRGIAGARAEFQFLRDQLRTDLAGLGVVVGDICTWSIGNVVGMMFELYDATNNTAFYFIGGYESTATTAPDVDDYLGGSGVNLRTRVKSFSVAFASASTSPQAGLTVGCNPDTTISRVDLEYDNATAMTYVGGDFTALATLNPDSLAGLQAIFPAHATYAMSTDLVGSFQVAHVLGYDNTAAVWLYMNEHATQDSRNICMWGPTLDPSAGGDTNEYGTVYVYGTQASTQDFRGFSHQFAEVHAFDPGGTDREYDLSPNEDLDSGNYKVTGGVDDGKLNWKKIEVNNGTGGSGIKGHVKENLMVEIGIYRDGQFKLRPIEFPDAANPVVCYTESCAIWWEAGARMFPSYVSYNR